MLLSMYLYLSMRRLKEIRDAMAKMPQMIAQYKVSIDFFINASRFYLHFVGFRAAWCA